MPRNWRTSWLPRELVSDSSWMLGGQLMKIGAQAGYFIVLVRALGASEFGVLAAALAIVAVAVPFAGWGSGNVMIMRTARDRAAFRVSFGTCFLTIAVCGLALSVLTSAVATTVIGRIPVSLAVEIALADLVFARVVETCSQAYQGFGRLAGSAQLATLPTLFRFVAACGFVLVGGATAERWGPWYLGASAIAALVATAVTVVTLDRPALAWRNAAAQWKEGFSFAVGASSATIYNDIDKTLVARLASFGAAGIYAAASRVVGLAFTPIYAIFTAAYYRFFVHGAEGIRGTVAFARRLAAPLFALGLASAAGLWLVAPLVPHILGEDFAAVTTALRWLAVVPILQVAFYLAGDVLTGAGRQATRSGIQVGAAILNVGLCLWLIPAYSWRGAAAATVATDALLAAALWLAVFGVVRRDRSIVCPVVA